MASWALLRFLINFLILFHCILFVVAYNIDTGIITLFKPENKTRSFGYSIAQSVQGNKPRLIIGAPLGYIYPKRPKLKSTGTIYICEMDDGNCVKTFINYFNVDLTDYLNEKYPVYVTPYFDNMLLGATVHAPIKQDYNLNLTSFATIICAPLLTNTLQGSNFYRASGMCIQEGTGFTPKIKHCNGITVIREANQNPGVPTGISTNQKFPFQYFSNAAQGFSAASNLKSKIVIIGAPLADKFRGGFILSMLDECEGKRPGSSYYHRFFFTYPIGGLPPLKRNDSFIYGAMAGYSIATINVDYSENINRFNDDFSTRFQVCLNKKGCMLSTDANNVQREVPLFHSHVGVVLGAPGQGIGGGFAVFRVTSLKNPEILITSKELAVLVMWQVNSTEFGERLGTSILSMDINGDNFDDIIVGAPYHTDDKRILGGAVYLYLSKGKNLIDIDVPPEKIKITVEPENKHDCNKLECYSYMFGLSLANAGDLNLDGIDDLVISSPRNGLGVVYIYNGRKDWESNQDYQQIISVTSLKNKSDRDQFMEGTFGWSLSGGIDMNNDKLFDLSIGAFQSDRVALFFSRPILDVSLEVESKINKFDPEIDTTIPLNICLRIKDMKPNNDDILGGINYKVEEISITEKRFNIDGVQIFFKPGTIKLKEKLCNTIIPTFIKTSRDLMNPVTFQISLTTTNPERNDNKIISKYPIIKNSQTSKNISISFKTNCVSIPCKSNLKTEVSIEKLKLSTDDHRTYFYDTRDLKSIVAKVTVKNTNEDAYDPKVKIRLPDSLVFKKYDADITSCEKSTDSTDIDCIMKSPMTINSKEVIIYIFMEFRVDVLSSNIVEISANASTISDDIEPESSFDYKKIKITLTINMKLNAMSIPTSVFISGNEIGAAAIKKVDEIGQFIRHSYSLTNNGNYSVLSMSFIIYFPYEIAPRKGEKHGKYLLYLERAPNRKECIVDPIEAINPQNYDLVALEKSNSEKRLQKREIKDNDYGNPSQISNVLRIGCKKLGGNCAQIRCIFPEISPGKSESVDIYSRIWNGTFLSDDFEDYQYVELQSEAELVLSENLEDTTPEDNKIKLITTVHTDRRLEKKEVPLWIIILSAVAGLIILLILIAICYKCGFFKRNKSEDMFMHQGRKQKNLKNDL